MVDKSVNKFGYMLNDEVIFMIQQKTLVNISRSSPKVVRIRSTMCNFLRYILENRHQEFISDEDIMMIVWEKNGLQSSGHRLWQVARDAKYKLHEAGLRIELYYRKNRKGFQINAHYIVALHREDPVVKKDSSHLHQGIISFSG